MNKIYINSEPITAVPITDDQVRMFLDASLQDKRNLIRGWIQGWRMTSKTWTISSDIIGWDGINGSLEGDQNPIPIADIPENWQEIVINPGKS